MNPDSLKSFPWWLEGDLQCGHCLQAYATETACYCAHCDDELCSGCVVEIRQVNLILCRVCAESYDAETDSEST